MVNGKWLINPPLVNYLSLVDSRHAEAEAGLLANLRLPAGTPNTTYSQHEFF
jgi:hypothetical protein